MKRLGAFVFAARRRPRPWRGAATSCRSILPSIRTRSRSRRSLPTARPTRCATARSRPMSDSGLRFAGAPPAEVRAIELLGSFVTVRVNPDSALARDEASACAAVKAIVRELARRQSDVILHPYPVTPLHGDYLHHVDLAAAAKARLSGRRCAGSATSRSRRAAALRRAIRTGRRRDADWDVEVVEVGAAELDGRRDLRGERLARAALGADRLVPCRAPARRRHERSGAQKQRVAIRSAAAQGRRLRGAGRAHQSGARPGRGAHRRLPQDRRRLHGETRIRQCRVLGRDREHRLRCDRWPAFADLHPHGEAQGFSLERLARARHRRRRRRPPGTRSAA